MTNQPQQPLPCPFCGDIPIPDWSKVIYDFHHKPNCFIGGRTLIGASEVKRWNTRANLLRGGDASMPGTGDPIPNTILTSPEKPNEPSRGKTIDQLCGEPEGSFKQFIKDEQEKEKHPSPSSDELDKAIEVFEKSLWLAASGKICAQIILAAAKQSREFQEQNVKLLSIISDEAATRVIKWEQEVEGLKQQLRADKELIKKFIDICEMGCFEHSTVDKMRVEALTLAREQGYGKEI